MSSEQDKLKWLIDNYFSDPNRWMQVTAGTVVMEQGQENQRLFLVRSGRLQGTLTTTDGDVEYVLTAGKDNFVGVYSFFSRTYISLYSVTAVTDCQLAWIDKNQPTIASEEAQSIEKQFMPVVVQDLVSRQRRMLEISQEKERTFRKLVEHQRLASLGQMAAGIAHELNNAIAVLDHNTRWLVEQVSRRWKHPQELAIFEAGLLQGRFLSTREIRENKRELQKNLKISEEQIALLAETGLPRQTLLDAINQQKMTAAEIFSAWEMGASLKDMLMAAEQSAHVVRSIKTLGAQHKERNTSLNLNETIENALSLLHHRLKNVETELHLEALPGITGNIGDFVQVWTNLVKNAVEAMMVNPDRQARLTVRSGLENKTIRVLVTDNGPGIPDEILPIIFQPNLTTKKEGLSFGLGLGLTIVERIVTSYHGKIEVQSSTEGTTFIISIPTGA